MLAEHCYKCHSAEATKGLKGGLALDSREASRKGGDSGPAVVPGEPDESLLIEAIRFTDEALQMPPEGRLPAETIADLERWVAMGAPDPRGEAAPRPAATSWQEVLREPSGVVEPAIGATSGGGAGRRTPDGRPTRSIGSSWPGWSGPG